MKKIATLLTAIFLASGIGFAQKAQKQDKKKETLEFRLDEEICVNCKRKIDNYIAFEKGVTAINYGEDGSTVQVTYRADRTDSTKLSDAFKKVKLEVVETKRVEEKKK